MPSTEHEAIVDLFRDNPTLAPRFIALLFGMNVPAYKAVTISDSTLNQTAPVEFHADLVLELQNEQQQPELSIVIEVQRDVDRRKELTWPAYVSVRRVRGKCPTVLLVVTTNADVAAWASKPIDLGLGLAVMRPLVLGPAVIPVITDPVLAMREPELALLSALSHDESEQGENVVATLLHALLHVEHEHTGLYFELVYNHVRDPLKRAIEAMIMERQTARKPDRFPPFAQVLVDRGIREGELKGVRNTLLRLLKRAGLDLNDEQRARIEACSDITTLERWTDNVIGAKTIADVFGSE
jgi:hypothetical protein